ncbi:probable 3-hydroxyisobutyryl-CoA hydrolase 2 [Arachis hypogaea]|uniref:probable 3-hydroxyisobutyryl-CoA hydrolase 2 n=1 Tax=Arachis hypogaea TaxID=3818 RepID=UPI003B217733
MDAGDGVAVDGGGGGGGGGGGDKGISVDTNRDKGMIELFINMNKSSDTSLQKPIRSQSPTLSHLVITNLLVVVSNCEDINSVYIQSRQLTGLATNVSQILKNLRLYENDFSIKLVILKANGKAFSAGGDIVSLIASSLVSLINGVAIGGGAALSMRATFRVVTENAIFAMPEVHIGVFPDCGACHFLSSLPGYFGEYLGLTGTRLDAAEMIACGLATHFIPSMKLNSLENALQNITSSNVSTIATLIETFTEKANVKEDSPFKR